MQFKITYEYDNPCSAGPFKGKAMVKTKMKKGDSFYGPFGAATVKTCSKVRNTELAEEF